ncbi:hypothetical protein Droror1_Dr00013035 [Drosera rotundifolia]
MASPGATSSGSSALHQISSPEAETLQIQKLDERKRKRMESNRESARRSRMRKQQHLDELVAQITHLKQQNSDLTTKMNLTTENYITMEAENSVLRAQVAELNSRLQSLDEIIQLLDVNSSHGIFADHNHGVFGGDESVLGFVNDFSAAGAADCLMIGGWSSLCMNQQQPIMANASHDHVFQY